ncbi:hypothetical protein [Burkholderia stabilis]|uniref:hypothetical protein n=1 Tax=Burkholderia stabilis TaxID=95485 RepID=UPI0012EA49B2|nr:hypothetical protein [Burkholderia stabilis]HDR9495209.1 hypothetical protein [Burkholderia stabilis]HDR9526930.1 hypothetical protein [Burkholderia stabilis]HDR9534276.1 hypothetical protein [Burkholderia stabilis]HDR9542553.1 hypothetical protein [Burkholderia stabilis]HDR9549702.1 hypothetical protein [Burkholderia stabilis]
MSQLIKFHRLDVRAVGYHVWSSRRKIHRRASAWALRTVLGMDLPRVFFCKRRCYTVCRAGDRTSQASDFECVVESFSPNRLAAKGSGDRQHSAWKLRQHGIVMAKRAQLAASEGANIGLNDL